MDLVAITVEVPPKPAYFAPVTSVSVAPHHVELYKSAVVPVVLTLNDKLAPGVKLALPLPELAAGSQVVASGKSTLGSVAKSIVVFVSSLFIERFQPLSEFVETSALVLE